jgi:transposase
MDAALLQAQLPAESGLRIEHVAVEASAIVVEATTTSTDSPCPRCRRHSTTRYGRYRRSLRDRSCRGRPLRLTLAAWKFVCPQVDCPQRLFCERLPGLARAQARTTLDLDDAHRSIGLALGGEAGARLAARLAIPTSADTILRRVKNTPAAPATPPRYVGIDDWATRKGQSYGTILIDLERRCVIELLPGRDGEALKQWLAANPQVEVITRDRWPAYIEAATAAAPQAKQVADRFHLLRNVRDAVEKLLSRFGTEIRTASADVDAATSATPPPVAEKQPIKSTDRERLRELRRGQRQERFQQVKTLTAQGLSCRVIARRLGMNVKAVLRYRRLDRCPDWEPGRTAPTQLDAFAPFIADWIAAGHRNSADLDRVLRTQGYRGGYDAVRRYLNRRIGSSGRPGRRGPDTQPPRPKVPSARKLSFRLVNPKPDSRSARVLERLRTCHPQLNEALGLAEELLAMLRRTCSTPLAEWATKAEQSGQIDLRNLARSLAQDSAAVTAAITLPWNNGSVEGQVGRLKLIKRQMYGRAGMALLKARVRHKG